MATLVQLNAAKCPSCKFVLLRPVPGSTYEMLCVACGYHTTANDHQCPNQQQQLRSHFTLLPTVKVTDTSQNSSKFVGNCPSTSICGSILGNASPHGSYEKQDSRDHPSNVASAVSSYSSSANSSPTHSVSRLPLPPVTTFPLGIQGTMRRRSCQLLEGQSASTPSR